MQETHLYIRPGKTEAPMFANRMLFAFCYLLNRRRPYLLQKGGLLGFGNGSLTQTTAASERKIICKIRI